MKKLFLWCLLISISTFSYSQNNNPVSIYEGAMVQSVEFRFTNAPSDTTLNQAYQRIVRSEFRIMPQTQFNSFLASYYISKLNLLPFVSQATMNITLSSQNGVDVVVKVSLSQQEQNDKRENIAKNARLFPVLYNSDRTFLTLKAAASEMAYSNNNAWFGQPTAMTNGNPLATNPVGAGYTAWLEGFASVGIYGIVKVIPKINLHLYGGANYLVSFSAGSELFTDKGRFHGDIEEAFVGLIGGGRTASGKTYRYNLTYGRKQFTLGDGWLIINTSMNGDNRAALQLNPRWAGKSLLQAGFNWDKLQFQLFQLKPNELDILTSNTIINGANVELSNKRQNGLLAASFLSVPRSGFRYFTPDGQVYSREGLQVYNLRLFKNAGVDGGLLLKLEGGYQRNSNFNMSAWAYYAELGWKFGKVQGTPTISYRYAYFGGDNPESSSYNRWDALYTGGNGEQWVQGSNMYKIVQNSNEISHRLQVVYNPLKKVQLVGQLWLFYAAQLNNIGGNPALSTLQSKIYGSEINLTIKYFHSKSWYFHLNTAYTIPSGAIRDLVADTRNWYCLSFFARYSF